jgi:hypothetical protein
MAEVGMTTESKLKPMCCENRLRTVGARLQYDAHQCADYSCLDDGERIHLYA